MNEKFLISGMIMFISATMYVAGINMTEVQDFHNDAGHKGTYIATKRWLQFPVKNGAKKRNVIIEVEGSKFRYFNIELTNEIPDWYAYVDLKEIKGKSFDIIVDTLPETSPGVFPKIKLLDKKPKDKGLYKERYRGQIHYSVATGWNNDANGMVYYNGQYHLFYQYNPYGRLWGNMHWGHATSKDLVHWKEQDIALYQDETGMMYSGSGIVDMQNKSGLSEKSGIPPMILYYTATASWDQRLAYSTDGRTFKKLNSPVLNKITPRNRDPKVIWYEPEKKWIMVLYVTGEDEQHCMYFFSSQDLKDWHQTGIYYGGKGKADKYMHECPEFFELPVDGNPGNTKWVLMDADGEYATGTFDGKVFKAEQERLESVTGGGYYAAQQFNNEPKGRRVEMAWFKTKTNEAGMNFNGSFSIPMELKLKQMPEGVRLTRQPVEELKILRKKTYTFLNKTVGETVLVKDIHSDIQEIEAVIDLASSKEFRFEVRGIDFSYKQTTGELFYKNKAVKVPTVDGKLKLHLFTDRTGLEVFVNDGLLFISTGANLNPQNTSVRFSTSGGSAAIEKMNIYRLKSIW